MKQFFQSPGFNALVAGCTRLPLSSTLWVPLFDNNDGAEGFARYVGGFARRVVRGATTRASAHWSKRRTAFLAQLSILFPGWGCEEGAVVCEGNEVAGIALTRSQEAILLPVKQHRYTARTRSGSQYVGFADGTAFCRSPSDGPKPPGLALYFARSHTDAEIVQEHGGELQVSTEPAVGLYPLYVTGSKPSAGARGGLVFDRRSFRVGTSVQVVTLAQG